MKKINSYTLWVKYENSLNKTAIPVRYEMKGYNTLLLSHYDHYYINYLNYENGIKNQSFLDIKFYHPCIPIRNITPHHIFKINPIQEFIYPRSSYDHVIDEHEKFKEKFNKTSKSIYENESKFKKFMNNLRFINSKNRENLGYELSMNHLMDYDDSEYDLIQGYQNNDIINYLKYKEIVMDIEKIPLNFDWRLFGAVTPILDQGLCGSCWAFSALGSVEGAYFIKTNGTLIELSKQALIDCSWGEGNAGCNGGSHIQALNWINKYGGTPSKDDYGKYLGIDGYCHAYNLTLIAPIKEFNLIHSNINSVKKVLITHGPISIGIYARHKSFKFYSNGVYYNKDCYNQTDRLTHSVLLIGYGNLNGEDYWIIKNSWSNHWGNNGYVFISMKDNNCGVLTRASFVTM